MSLGTVAEQALVVGVAESSPKVDDVPGEKGPPRGKCWTLYPFERPRTGSKAIVCRGTQNRPVAWVEVKTSESVHDQCILSGLEGSEDDKQPGPEVSLTGQATG